MSNPFKSIPQRSIQSLCNFWKSTSSMCSSTIASDKARTRQSREREVGSRRATFAIAKSRSWIQFCCNLILIEQPNPVWAEGLKRPNCYVIYIYMDIYASFNGKCREFDSPSISVCSGFPTSWWTLVNCQVLILVICIIIINLMITY